MISDSAAAQLGLLVQYATDMCAGPQGLTTLEPQPDRRLASDWKIRGYICGADTLFRPGSFMALRERNVCYGFLAESTHESGAFVAVIRDVEGIVEWIGDAKFAAVPCPAGGTVERGFWAVYKTLELRINGDQQDIVSGIVSSVGSGALMVVGHGLGGALATYLTLDLADPTRLGKRASACLFASPQTGDSEFACRFDRIVTNYTAYNYDLDIVPRMPMGFAYTTLPSTQWINPFEAQARIRFDFRCHHHVLCYCAMLDFSSIDWGDVPPSDRDSAPCITGPSDRRQPDFRQEALALKKLNVLRGAIAQWEQRTSGSWRTVLRKYRKDKMARSTIWQSDIFGELSDFTTVLRDVLQIGYKAIGRHAAESPETDVEAHDDTSSLDGYYASSAFKENWTDSVRSAVDDWTDYVRTFIGPTLKRIADQSDSLVKRFEDSQVEPGKALHALAMVRAKGSVREAVRANGNKPDASVMSEIDSYCERVQRFLDSTTKLMVLFDEHKQKLLDSFGPIEQVLARWKPLLHTPNRWLLDDDARSAIASLCNTLDKMTEAIAKSTTKVDNVCLKWLNDQNVRAVSTPIDARTGSTTGSGAISELEGARTNVYANREYLREVADGEVRKWSDGSVQFFTKNAVTLLGLGSGALLVFGALYVLFKSMLFQINFLKYSTMNDLTIRGALVVPWIIGAVTVPLLAHLFGKGWAARMQAGNVGEASLSRLSRAFAKMISRISPEALFFTSCAAVIGLMLLSTGLWNVWRLERMREGPEDTRIYMSNAVGPLLSSGIVDAMTNYLFAYQTGPNLGISILPSRRIRCIEGGKSDDMDVDAACNGLNWGNGAAETSLGGSVRQYVQEVEGCNVPEGMPILSVGFAFNQSAPEDIRSWFYDPPDNWGFTILPGEGLKLKRIAFLQSPKESTAEGGFNKAKNSNLIEQIEQQFATLDRLMHRKRADVSSLWFIGLSSQRGNPTDNQVLANKRIDSVESLFEGMHFAKLPTIRRRALGVNVLTDRRPPKLKWLDQRVVIVPCRQSVYR